MEMKNSLWAAIALVTMLTLVSTAAFAVVPPHSEDFETGTIGNSVTTLGWRVPIGQGVQIAGSLYPGWGSNSMSKGQHNYDGEVNYAFYDFTAPITTGQLSLSFDAYSYDWYVGNGDFGIVQPDYTAGHPGIRWASGGPGATKWALAVPGGGTWYYSGGGSEPVHLEIYIDQDAKLVSGAITDSTGRHVSPTMPTANTGLTALGFYSYSILPMTNQDFAVDNIVLTHVVPEPGVLLSLGTGLLALAGFGLKRRAG